MRSRPSALAPFFRSDAQGLILARVLLAGDQQSLTEIAASASVPTTTVHREVERLVKAGVLLSEKRGSVRFVKPNPDYLLMGPLRQMVAAAYGAHHVVVDSFSGLPGLEQLVIFGSWAARLAGEAGPMPNDIDVLLIGDVDDEEAFSRAYDAGVVVGLDVNPTFLSVKAWADTSDGFVATVKARPMVDMTVRLTTND